eukprot:CAMPEP_0119270958 /NCGR_PEP_ID=MMETSP1329-20130426/7752_1 /TAXON_ID=114041 /ORGANISM="Genus nov. species nov., Strain RCC1024" /LENGTH=157 /DNA_ID=CAMNT_0007270995 /DNA_START=119 /DNA_END=589 /DNA_ORIENTATION=-
MAEAVDDDAAPICRICYESEGPLLRPCDCSGSMAYVHAGCLARWLGARPDVARRGCQVCKGPWKVVTRPTVSRFLVQYVARGRGAEAARRLLRHVAEPDDSGDDSDGEELDAGFGDEPDPVDRAAAAAVRLALWALFFGAAVAQGRLALRLFAAGVR